MSREKLTELLARVEAATGPDREIDRALGGLEFQFEADEDGRPYVRYSSPGGWEPLPAYTASIDAALALVQRALPGAVWHVMTDYGGLNRAKIGPEGRPSASIYRVEDRHEFAQADADTPPLALLAALLRALSRDTP